MTSAVTDTGYWMAEATGDDAPDVFDAGGNQIEQEHQYTTNTHSSSPNIDIDHIRNILTKEPSHGDTEHVGDTEDVGVFDEEDVQEISETHPDPSPDGTYTYTRPKRSTIPTQKAALNEKWSDTKQWAQRAIAHTKCDKTLVAERLYCRQATLSHEDPNHHDFEPEFDLAEAVHRIAEMRSYQATELDDCEPLTYKQAMSGPYAKQWKGAMDVQMESFATMGTWDLVRRMKDMPVLTGKWVYKIKRKLDGSKLFKARWVVRGFEQIHGVNYD